ncbi:NorM family multidrug efflux MATE transporter [Pseudomonas massiliensis]|uniref:NorM family multidrug efflux MATE transporter n=1 Tax=Pseudomonas massiliensis TaxID=522492 RepID=UPI00058DF67F|nr:NorM family multidrug efflux MATE transporter [Pseudomonas massiliensis]
MPLTARSELAALMRLAGPLIASQLAHMLMILTDTVMMARLGPQALAGGSLGAASYSFVSIFCIGVIAAVGTLVSIRHGAADPTGVTRLTQAGLWLAWGLALVGAVLLWNLPPLLLVLGQAPENVTAASTFLRVLAFALPGSLSFMALRGFTSGVGKATPVMVISVAATVLNLVLNLALLDGWFGLPPLGLAGIGLVTATVATLMGLSMAFYIHRHAGYRAYPVLHGLARPCVESLKSLWRLGLPIGGTYAVEVGLFAFAALCMGNMGQTALGAHQIALQIVSVAFMVPAGLSYAVTLRIGQHYGAGQPGRVHQAGRIGIGFGALIMLSFSIVLLVAPERLVNLFIDASDPEFAAIYALALRLLAVAAWFELFDGVQTIAMGAIRGLKDARLTFLVGLCCYWLLGAPAAWLLGFHFGQGAVGVWWGLALGLACAAVSLTVAFEWKMKRLRPALRSSSEAAA